MRAVHVLCLVLSASMVVSTADARKRRKKSRRAKAVPTVATKQQVVAVEKLLKPFKWGMSSAKVMSLLEKEIRHGYKKPLKEASKDPYAYDKLRKEMMARVSKLKKSIVRFEGKRVSWDVSLVDKQFTHKNNESMLVRWGDEDRRFFFFHYDKLWKVYIAFNVDRFRGRTFADFAGVMEARFGAATRKYRTTIKGDAEMAYLHWPPSKTTILRAIDNTGFYGNFCMVLIDRNELPRVQEGRRLNAPGKRTSDPLIDSVTREEPGSSRENENVVDQITGRGSSVSVSSDTYQKPSSSGSSSSGNNTPPPERPRKRKKIDKDNPLEGLDL